MSDLSEGKVISLAEAVEFVVDNRGRTAPTSKDGIPLIATNCIDSSDLYPAYKNVRYVSRDTYDNWFRSHPKPDDIIITLKGSKNGAVCLVPNPVDFAIAQDMVALRADEDIIYPYYLFAVLRSREVQHQIKTLDVSGVIPHLKKTDFDKLIFPCPSRGIQKQIGDTYYAFCNKIELLREQNKTLETLAQTIFKAWFVNFNYPDATGDMVESELGLIPKGWRVGKIKDFVNILSGFAFKSKDFVEGGRYGLVTIRNVQDGSFVKDTKDGLNTLPEKMPAYCHLKTGDILLSLTGNVGRVCHVIGESYLLNQRVAKLQAKEKTSFGFVYLFFRQSSVLNEMENISSGTAQQNLSPIKTAELGAIIPNLGVLTEFSSIVNPMIEKMLSNEEQIQTLSKTRDALLPKLMSGQVRVT